jgi:hypothetical protein
MSFTMADMPVSRKNFVRLTWQSATPPCKTAMQTFKSGQIKGDKA